METIKDIKTDKWKSHQNGKTVNTTTISAVQLYAKIMSRDKTTGFLSSNRNRKAVEASEAVDSTVNPMYKHIRKSIFNPEN